VRSIVPRFPGFSIDSTTRRKSSSSRSRSRAVDGRRATPSRPSGRSRYDALAKAAPVSSTTSAPASRAVATTPPSSPPGNSDGQT